mgnify:CR=1 FL=1
MGFPFPLIPAEAGTQSFGRICDSVHLDRNEAKGSVRGSHWVPASAGMSGEYR